MTFTQDERRQQKEQLARETGETLAKTSTSRDSKEMLSVEDKEYLDKIRERWYIMQDGNNFLFYYNFCVVAAAMFQGIYIPFQLFFVDTIDTEKGGLEEG